MGCLNLNVSSHVCLSVCVECIKIISDIFVYSREIILYICIF